MKDKDFVWNVEETRVVRFSFIRNFTLEEKEGRGVNIIGWFNDKESFRLKVCKDFVEAHAFLKGLIE
jgi:hypothetical protein